MATDLPSDISLDGLNFTRAQEGRALRAYQDSVGVWTIGYGLTNYDKGLPFLPIKQGLTITEEQAEWYLLKSLRGNYLPAARSALAGGTYAHPQGAVDGAADFHYNTGGVKKATWPGALGRGDLASAKESLLSWNKAGGRVLSGLTRRREGNWSEVSEGTYGHLAGPGVVEPNASGREVDTNKTGDILTAFPADPQDIGRGNVATDGPPPPPKTPAPGVLQKGSTGPQVIEVQTELSTLGYVVPATGTYDDATVSAVTSFQQAHPNLTADGKVGPATSAAILRAIAMKEVAGKVVKTATPAGPGIWIAVHQWVGAHEATLALGAMVAILVGVAAYYGWKHRHDAHGWLNSIIGRVVP